MSEERQYVTNITFPNGNTYYVKDTEAREDIEELKRHGGSGGSGDVNVQSDWNQTDSTADDYIKNKPDIYTKNEVDQKLVSAMTYKGAKATVSELPNSGNQQGDVWHINEDGSEYAWNGSSWEELGKDGDAVLYTEQFLTPAQQEQARENIGAIDYSNLNAVVPEQYGAVGDGETDDTTAVRAALKAAIDEGKTLFLPKKYYVTQSLLTANDYSTCTLKIEGASPRNREQYSIGAFGGIKFANGLNLFDGLTIRGSMHCVSFMPVSRTQTGSIFNGCLLSKFTFDSCFVSNVLAFCHNTNVASTSRIKDSTFLTVYYFAKCDEGNKYFTDSTIGNCYINGGSEMNDNNCFEWYNWNGSNVTGNFVDYYRTIYSPVLSERGQFQAPVSSNNQYQVFRYFYFVSNVTSFQFQSEADCFNWNDPSTSQKLTDYVALTYTGRDSVVRDIPPYILLVTEEGAVEINNAVIQNNIGNIVFVRRGLGNYSFSRAKLTCSLRDHRRSYDSSVQVADSIYGAGSYRDNLIDIPFAKPVDSLPSIGLTWSINYPGMRVRYNNRQYRYMWLYDGSAWVATWVDEAIGAYKTSMLQNDSGYQTAAQVSAAITGKLDTAQGTANAGKFMVVGSDGDIAPVTMAAWQGADGRSAYECALDEGYVGTEQQWLASLKASNPIFVGSETDMADPNEVYVYDGYIWAAVTTSGTIPKFTNLLQQTGAEIKAGKRYSHGSAAFVDNSSPACDSIIVPIPANVTNLRIRLRGAALSTWNNAYGGTSSSTFPTQFGTHDSGSSVLIDENGDQYFDIVNSGSSYMVFMVSPITDTDGVVVTVNEPIEYESGITTEFRNTNVPYAPADYEGRIHTLEYYASHLMYRDGETPRAPVPQLPADGTTGTDLNANTATADDVYAYLDAICAKYPNMLVKQTMGRDYSNTYDCNRYIFCRAGQHAWARQDYPKMFAWKNGSTVIYSESVSPRVGDSMYSVGNTTGAAVGTVSSVNFVDGTASVSTRTVNGTVYSRDAEHDVAPTLIYTDALEQSGDTYIVQGVTYLRYPFGDKYADGSEPVRVFILANEHGGMNYGDPKEAAIVCARMLKDLCTGVENDFLHWMRDNVMLTVIPVGNPWGFNQNEQNGYMTANHVNINRNYDVPGWVLGPNNAGGLGAYPGSEPETQYIMDTIQLSGAEAGMSVHVLGNDSSWTNAHYQGNGFDPAKMPKIAEVLAADYGLDLTSYGVGADQDPWHCGKSPAYIQYAGLNGGLIELNRHNTLTGTEHDAAAMEQCYTQVLLFLWTWIGEKVLESVDGSALRYATEQWVEDKGYQTAAQVHQSLADYAITTKLPYPNRVINIGHRGALPNTYPENTVPAFAAAAKLGFDYVEFDVRATSDGVLVCLHDAAINSVARNTDGTTLSETINIADITYEQAMEYVFCSNHYSKYPTIKICTVEDAIKTCAMCGIGAWFDVYIEPTTAVLDQIFGWLDAYNMKNKAVFNSATYLYVDAIHAYDDEVAISTRSSTYSSLENALTGIGAFDSGKNRIFVNVRQASMPTYAPAFHARGWYVIDSTLNPMKTMADYAPYLDAVLEEDFLFSDEIANYLMESTGQAEAPLLNLNRQMSQNQSAWYNSAYYLNPAQYNYASLGTNACTVADLTESSITVTEGGDGGTGCAFPLDITDLYGKTLTLSWDATGTSNTRFRLIAYTLNGTGSWKNTLIDNTGTKSSSTIEISADGMTITVDGTAVTHTEAFTHVAFFFGSATSTTTAYSGVTLTEQ